MTLPPRWERFVTWISDEDDDVYWNTVAEELARVLAEHDAERAGPDDSTAAETQRPGETSHRPKPAAVTIQNGPMTLTPRWALWRSG